MSDDQIQTIDITHGANEPTYQLTLTDKNGANISTVSILLAIGTFETPGQWYTPDTDTAPSIDKRVVTLLVGPGGAHPAPGEYWLHVKITDGDRVYLRKFSQLTLV